MRAFIIIAQFLCIGVSPSVIETSSGTILFHQVLFLLNVTRSLDQLYQFDNLILYRTPAFLTYTSIMESRVNGSNIEDAAIIYDQVIVKYFIIPSMVFSIAPWDYADDVSSIPNLGNILTNKNLAIVILNDIFNKELKEFVALSLGASLETKIVFLLIGHELTNVPVFIRMEKLRSFFRWCWAKNILNAILIFQKDRAEKWQDLKLEVYTYTPFPRPIALIRLTAAHPNAFYTVKTFNLMGYKFKTPVLSDKPNVFTMTNPETGKEFITGTAGRLFMEFVDKMNGTFSKIPHKYDINYEARKVYINELLQKRLIDIAINPFTCLLSFEGFGSYPITHTNSCVVVPFVSEINRSFYIPYTFNVVIWVILLVMFVLFFVLHLLEFYRLKQRYHICEAFICTLQGMLNLSSSSTLRQSSYFLESKCTFRVVYTLLTISGLIFTHLHVASLTSLLSTTMYGRQLETVEELRAANVTIMLPDHHANLYQILEIFPQNFSDHLLITDPQQIAQHQNTLNTSFAYIVYEEEWRVMRQLQSNLWKPLFKIAPKLCIPNMYFALPLQFNSPFYRPLREFILWTHASGLERKWSDMVFSEIQQESGKLSEIESREHPVAITVDHLVVAWLIWMSGILISFIAFLIEMKHKDVHALVE